jgi:threonine aldolase
MIDFRSDTLTQPTEGMRKAMSNAPLGDDVFGEDPSINHLEAHAAALFGMDSALFCPSGTMTNQIAIMAHARAGEDLICDQLSHVYLYEGGGIAANAGASVSLLAGNRGRLTAAQVATAVHPLDLHKPISRLVCLENTANRGGGACYDFTDIQAISQVCKQNNLSLHLDGARLFNALVAKGESTQQYGKVFDSISICLSKGLGAPVGSLLLGNKNFIAQSRRIRKRLGGGMRQAGILAAAGQYALDHHIDRLALDHHHAALLQTAFQAKDFCLEYLPVETNILMVRVAGRFTGQSLVETLRSKGILCIAMTPEWVRFVTHLDLSEEMIQATIREIAAL